MLLGVILFSLRKFERFILCLLAIKYGESPALTLYGFVSIKLLLVVFLGIKSTCPIVSLVVFS